MNAALCTICARGGSKGVQNKNCKTINGKPLIAYSIQQALSSGLFEHVVVSTDSDTIADIAVDHGAEVFFKRAPELSGDKAGKIAVIRDAFIRSEQHFNQQFDHLVDLDATAPLRSVQDIHQSFQQFLDNENDNLITAMPSRRSPYFNLIEVSANGAVQLSKQLDTVITRRQDSPKCYDMNASIYIWKRETILNEPTLFLPKTGLYVMPEERSIDIDTPLDFEFVQFILDKNNAK